MNNSTRASKKKAAAKRPAAKKPAAKKAARKKSSQKAAAKAGKQTAQKSAKSVRAGRKAATKTATTKAPATRKAAKTGRPLVQAKFGETFWATDGQIIANLLELKEALARMSDTTFAYHVTKEKNDFAAWVELALQDRDCADALRRSRKRNTAHAVVVRHLKSYTY